MERISLGQDNIEEVAQKAAAVLRRGGVVLYPTDTLYALGADTTNTQAVEKVFAIKHRAPDKQVSSVYADVDAAALYAPVTELARTLADRFLPGKLTLVLSDTCSVRVPAQAFCLMLADTFGKPFTATSANRAGEADLLNVDAILAQLGAGAENIDLIIDAGELAPSQPSTVVDVRGEKPVILREGAVPATDITAA